MKVNKLQAKLDELNIDGMLVSSGSNRRYISGFTGSTGVCLISKNESKFITDFRYIEQANSECDGFEIVDVDGYRNYPKVINDLAKEMGMKRLGFEGDFFTFSDYTAYKEVIEAEFISISNGIESIRTVKSDAEIAKIKIAAEIADATFAHILKFIKEGVTEREVSNEMEMFMRHAGATCSSFDTIVASGWRSALPHGIASDKVIQTGEAITLDFGAKYDGYVSDMTRTIFLGNPSDKLKEVYHVVLGAQLNAQSKIRPGISGMEADSYARDYITEKGYGAYFGHGLGHGIGLDVHEGPSLSKVSTDILEVGNIVTNEPGIYLPNIGGVRIEDDLVITEEGNYSLTISSKELIII